MNLHELARQLQHAATAGSREAGSEAVHAGTFQAEIGMRPPGTGSGVTVATSELSARIGATQKRGVYQEAAPATAPHVSTAAIADTMAHVAAAAGAEAVT